MNYFVYLCLALLVVSCGAHSGQADSTSDLTSDSTASPDSPLNSPTADTLRSYLWRPAALPNLQVTAGQGVAGGVAAVFDGALMLYGGANFPHRPPSEGGRKCVYGDCFVLRDTAWQKLPTNFPPRAYAAVAHTEQGVYVLGGNDGAAVVDDVLLWTGMSLSVVGHLPVACENAAAAYADGYVYVVGGQTPQGASAALYRAHVDSLAEGWQRLPDLPRGARVQPAAAWLDGLLYVAGGYDPGDGTVNATLVAYDPEASEWRFIDSLRRPGEMQTTTLVGGSMLADGRAHRLLFIGGVDARIFQEAISRPSRLRDAERSGNLRAAERLRKEAADYLCHDPEWYRFCAEVMSYSPSPSPSPSPSETPTPSPSKTSSLSHTPYSDYRHETNHPALARAGAAVVMHSDTVYVVNGELKPGVRATTCVMLTR